MKAISIGKCSLAWLLGEGNELDCVFQDDGLSDVTQKALCA